jgi:hypothetical protein
MDGDKHQFFNMKFDFLCNNNRKFVSRIKNIPIILIFIFLLFGLFVPALQAASYYVDQNHPSNSDTNPGTENLPWQTIGRAADVVMSGDTVCVKEGTYNERVIISRPGAFGAPIIYKALGNVLNKGFTVEANHIHIVGFEITDTDDDDRHGVGIYMAGSYIEARENNIHDISRWGFRVFNSNNVIKGNRIYRAGCSGIWLEGRDHIVEGNDISRTIQYPEKWRNPPSWVDADGITIDGRGFIIRKNFIHDIYASDPENDDPHIDCLQIPGNCEGYDLIIEQNRFGPIPRSNKRRYQVAMIGSGNVGNIVFRNNIINGLDRGLNFMGEGSEITGFMIHHNTWVDLSSYCVGLTNASEASVKYNIFYNIPYWRGYMYMNNSARNEIGNNLTYMTEGSPYPGDLWGVNPKFVDPDNGDFSLQPGSRACGAGDDGTDIGAIPCDGSTTDTEAPSMPSNLKAQAVSSSQIILSWDASTDNVRVTGYNIYRNGPRVGSSTSTTYHDSGLAPSTTYTYAVSAHDAAGKESVPSDSVSITTQASVPAEGIIEAESGGLTPPMQTISDSEASGGSYIQTTGSLGSATFTFYIEDCDSDSSVSCHGGELQPALNPQQSVL